MNAQKCMLKVVWYVQKCIWYAQRGMVYSKWYGMIKVAR